MFATKDKSHAVYGVERQAFHSENQSNVCFFVHVTCLNSFKLAHRSLENRSKEGGNPKTDVLCVDSKYIRERQKSSSFVTKIFCVLGFTQGLCKSSRFLALLSKIADLSVNVWLRFVR